MRKPAFEAEAAKRTVSVTLNSDLYSNAKSVGLNISKVAEEALAVAYVDRRRALLLAEVQQDLAAFESYVAEHGSFADLVRQHYQRDDDAV
jgi:antitoxin CcdA